MLINLINEITYINFTIDEKVKKKPWYCGRRVRFPPQEGGHRGHEVVGDGGDSLQLLAHFDHVGQRLGSHHSVLNKLLFLCQTNLFEQKLKIKLFFINGSFKNCHFTEIDLLL